MPIGSRAWLELDRQGIEAIFNLAEWAELHLAREVLFRGWSPLDVICSCVLHGPKLARKPTVDEWAPNNDSTTVFDA